MASSSHTLFLKPAPHPVPESKNIYESKNVLYEFNQAFIIKLDKYFKEHGWEAPTSYRVANFILSWTPIPIATNQVNAKKAYDVAKSAIELALKNEAYPSIVTLIILFSLEKMLKIRIGCPTGRVSQIIDEAFVKFMIVESAPMPISAEEFDKRKKIILGSFKPDYLTEGVKQITEDSLHALIEKFSKLSPSCRLLEQSTYPITDLVSYRTPPSLLDAAPDPERKSTPLS